MSGDNHEQQIERGLEIVDHILKLPQVQKPTYGRSAIGAPKTRERIAAWETFGASHAEQDPELERGGDDPTDQASGGDGGVIQPDDVSHNDQGSRCFKETNMEEADRDLFPDTVDPDIYEHGEGRRDPDGGSTTKIICIGSDQSPGAIKRKGGPKNGCDTVSNIQRIEDIPSESIRRGPQVPTSSIKTTGGIDPSDSDNNVHIVMEDDRIYYSHDGRPLPKDDPDVYYVSETPPEASGGVPFQKRLSALKEGVPAPDDPAAAFNDPEGVVKRGTEGSSVSNGTGLKSKLRSGATPFVPGSSQHPISSHASVDTVHHGARSPTVHQSPMHSGEEDQEEEEIGDQTEDTSGVDAENENDQDPYDYLSDRELLIDIHKMQTTILTKLDSLPDYDNDFMSLKMGLSRAIGLIESLDRSVGKLGLAVSEIEQMVSSMRIMIPGKPMSPGQSSASTNPTLKPIIGRQSQNPEEVIDIIFDDNGMPVPTAKGSLFLEEIDDTKTNASEFVIRFDKETKMTLKALIKNRVRDPDVSQMLLDSLKEAQDIKELVDIYADITSTIEQGF